MMSGISNVEFKEARYCKIKYELHNTSQYTPQTEEVPKSVLHEQTHSQPHVPLTASDKYSIIVERSPTSHESLTSYEFE